MSSYKARVTAVYSPDDFYGAVGYLDKEIREAGRTKIGVFEDTFIV